jgi:hypothetical protein
MGKRDILYSPWMELRDVTGLVDFSGLRPGRSRGGKCSMIFNQFRLPPKLRSKKKRATLFQALVPGNPHNLTARDMDH